MEKLTNRESRYRIKRVSECLYDNSINQEQSDLCVPEEQKVTIRVYDLEELQEKLIQRRINQEKLRSEIQFKEQILEIEDAEIIRLKLKISYLQE